MARPADAPLVWLFGEVKTPPFSAEVVGPGCHELRIPDRGVTWRILYHLAGDAILILDVFAKKTEATPQAVLVTCRRRFMQYQTAIKARTRG